MSRYGMQVITDEYIQRQQEKYAMAKQKARRKSLPKFPNANRDDEITEVRQELADLYDEAVAAQKRAAAINAAPAVDVGRFPLAGGSLT